MHARWCVAGYGPGTVGPFLFVVGPFLFVVGPFLFVVSPSLLPLGSFLFVVGPGLGPVGVLPSPAGFPLGPFPGRPVTVVPGIVGHLPGLVRIAAGLVGPFLRLVGLFLGLVGAFLGLVGAFLGLVGAFLGPFPRLAGPFLHLFPPPFLRLAGRLAGLELRHGDALAGRTVRVVLLFPSPVGRRFPGPVGRRSEGVGAALVKIVCNQLGEGSSRVWGALAGTLDDEPRARLVIGARPGLPVDLQLERVREPVPHNDLPGLAGNRLAGLNRPPGDAVRLAGLSHALAGGGLLGLVLSHDHLFPASRPASARLGE